MITTTMRGIVKAAPGIGAEYRTDIPIPQINDDEVLMKIHATAICGTDLHIYHWKEYASTRMKELPMVFGHETAGEIVEMGKNVTGYKLGDRISVETHIPCNHCFQCQTGNRHICENMKVFGVTEPGAFAEYAKVPKDCIVPLPDAVTYEMGAMLEAMGACKVHGAKQVIACDMFDQKLELARKMGADITVNSGKTDLTVVIREVTEGCGADAAIDITGSGRAIVAGLRALRKGGMMVSVGLPDGEVPINLTEDIIYREIMYTGVSGRRMFETWDDCMSILQSDNFSLEPVIGGVYKMEDFEEALSAIQSGAPGKMILTP